GLFTAIYAPRFRPDPGVYDQLEAPGTVIRGMFGWFDYNPDQYTLTRPDGTRYVYDQDRGVQRITDPLGNVVQVTDTGMSDASGVVLEFVHDARGRIRELRGPAPTPGAEPTRVLYEYDAAGDLVGVTNALGETTRFVYRSDPAHFLDAIIDPRGVTVFRAEFDGSGRLTSSVDALGGRVSQDFDPAQFRGTITDARGHVTELLYNERGNVVEERVPDPLDPAKTLVVRYEHNDPRHPDQPTRVIQRDGSSTEYAYDAAGNTAERTIRSADGQHHSTFRYQYDSQGNVLEFVDPRGNVTTFVYSAQNTPASVVNASGNTSYLGFLAGRQTSFTDVNGNTTTYAYAGDSPHELPSTTVFADGSYELRTWNRYGDVTSVRQHDANGRLTTATDLDYDHLRRLIRKSSGIGDDRLVTTYDYDGPTANVSRVTIVHPDDPSLSRVTVYEYDEAGHLLRRVDADQDPSDPTAGVLYKYDANGNRVWLRDPAGNVTTWIYDALNRVTEERDPGYWHGTDWESLTDAEILNLIGTPTPTPGAPYEPSPVTRYVYDAADRVTEEIDRNGRRRTFDYDFLGNRVREVWYDETDDTTVLRQISFSFDAAGNLVSAVDPDAQYVFTYDPLNRLRSMSVDYPWTAVVETCAMSYQRDAMGNVVAVSDATGVAVKSTFDERNRLASRWWEGTSGADVRADFRYAASGLLTDVVRFSDLTASQRVATTTRAYDLAGRSTDIVHTLATDEVLADYEYHYDSTGLLSRETLQHLNSVYSRVADYSHDLRGRLVAAMYDNGQEDELFSYDANGNRTLPGHVLGPANQLLSDGVFSYTYDGEGNLLTRTALAPVAGEANHTEFEYDFRNRCTKVTEYSAPPADGGILLHVESYRYDALGRRIAVVSGSDALISVYDGPSFVAHEWARLDGSGEVVQRFLYLSEVDRLLAQWTRGDGVAWFLTDHLGTVRDIIDNTGVPVQHIHYTAFGEPAFAAAGGPSHPYAFTGRVWDEIPGTSFHRARLYDPHTGRFLSQDPIGFEGGTFQLYEYASNLPTLYRDPTGHLGLITDYAITITFGEAVVTSALISGGISFLMTAANEQDLGIATMAGLRGAFFGGLAAMVVFTVPALLASKIYLDAVILSGVAGGAAEGFWQYGVPADARARAESALRETLGNVSPEVYELARTVLFAKLYPR
ncbi:MAG: hypothetical protein MUF48_20480, partial [Pirellulaceae bacterium]|nr:hypothetical protein [Pirellulaceae bacterium]